MLLLSLLQNLRNLTLSKVLQQQLLHLLQFHLEQRMVNEEIEAGNEDNDKANDEGLVVSDEGKGEGCARLDEGVEGPEVEDKCQGQGIHIRI